MEWSDREKKQWREERMRVRESWQPSQWNVSRSQTSCCNLITYLHHTCGQLCMLELMYVCDDRWMWSELVYMAGGSDRRDYYVIFSCFIVCLMARVGDLYWLRNHDRDSTSISRHNPVSCISPALKDMDELDLLTFSYSFHLLWFYHFCLNLYFFFYNIFVKIIIWLILSDSFLWCGVEKISRLIN